jgi:hypothetical protein
MLLSMVKMRSGLEDSAVDLSKRFLAWMLRVSVLFSCGHGSNFGREV